MTDELDQWMTAARDADDQQAFARVVEACHHLLRSTILRETADAELADEIAQEAMVRAWTKRAQYRPGTSPRAWMLAIARRQLIEHHRRRGRDRRHLTELVRHELLRHQSTTPEDHLNQARQAALNQCIQELSDNQRELIDLVHGQGLTTEDAADILGIKPAACRQRLSRLQRSLRTAAEAKLAESDA